MREKRIAAKKTIVPVHGRGGEETETLRHSHSPAPVASTRAAMRYILVVPCSRSTKLVCAEAETMPPSNRLRRCATVDRCIWATP